MEGPYEKRGDATIQQLFLDPRLFAFLKWLLEKGGGQLFFFFFPLDIRGMILEYWQKCTTI